jgi:carbonic anhydrase
MRKHLVAAALLALTLSAPVAAQEWSHDPTSAIGPTRWGTVTFPFATCGSVLAPGGFVEVGKKQSPIDIVGAQAAALPPPLFLYGNTPFAVENTGHVVEVPYAAGSRVLIGLDVFDLVQFHFHAPSEHAVNGRLADMELHLVHRNALGNLAVVGVLLQVGPRPNPVIEEVFSIAPSAEGLVSLPGRTLNALEVLPRNPFSFWTYSGSLTTPPCSEGVKWTVLKNPVNVSQATVNRFRAIIARFPAHLESGYSANNRPVTPLNGRAILGN